MKALCMLFAVALCAALPALAAEPVVILHDDAVKASPQHGNVVDIRQNAGSRCESPAIGACGSCAVSCPVGEAATCRPGRAVGKGTDASCIVDPSCVCK